MLNVIITFYLVKKLRDQSQDLREIKAPPTVLGLGTEAQGRLATPLGWETKLAEGD